MRRQFLRTSPLPVVLQKRVMSDRTSPSYPRRVSSGEKFTFSCEREIMHDLWVERELRIVAIEPTFLLIAWVFVPAWSLWQVFGSQKIKNIEEGLVFPPLATVAFPILLFSMLTAFVASTMSLLSQIFLPSVIRSTPPDERAVWQVQQASRTKTRVVYLLQMTSCVFYQVVVACAWVLGNSFSTFDLSPVVYMFAVTGIMWSTLVSTPYHNASV